MSAPLRSLGQPVEPLRQKSPGLLRRYPRLALAGLGIVCGLFVAPMLVVLAARLLVWGLGTGWTENAQKASGFFAFVAGVVALIACCIWAHEVES